MVSLVTELTIPAPADRVWRVLVDFASYPRWNPLLPEARGEAREGARVAFRARLVPWAPPLRFTGLVRACGALRLEWTGGVPLLLEGRHSFQLSEVPGGTHLVHREDFRGALAWAVRLGLGLLRPAYARMDHALARRVAEGG